MDSIGSGKIGIYMLVMFSLFILCKVYLKSYIENLPDKLDTYVQEGGLSLSAGQCQLLCFARALLRKVSLLLLF